MPGLGCWWMMVVVRRRGERVMAIELDHFFNGGLLAYLVVGTVVMQRAAGPGMLHSY